jgi:hypothetical protein
MSFPAKRELLVQVAPCYRETDHREKTIILEEFVAATGYARKYAIRLFHRPTTMVHPLSLLPPFGYISCTEIGYRFGDIEVSLTPLGLH